MPVTFYGLTSCDTCRAALKAIAAAGIDIDRKDVRADGVTTDILSQLLDAHGADAVINKRSTTWRGLDETERLADPVTLLQAHPALMKRPVILMPMAKAMLAGLRRQRQLWGLTPDGRFCDVDPVLDLSLIHI